ncbi:hypothetical protein FORC41_1713 [Escherichia coli]|nr:hypothetical protein FORC41_1713 [Escherichia coli]
MGKKSSSTRSLKSAGPSINTYRGRWLSINDFTSRAQAGL